MKANVKIPQSSKNMHQCDMCERVHIENDQDTVEFCKEHAWMIQQFPKVLTALTEVVRSMKKGS